MTNDEINRRIAELKWGADKLEVRVCKYHLFSDGGYEVQSNYPESFDWKRYKRNREYYSALCYKLEAYMADSALISEKVPIWSPVPDFAAGPYENVFLLVEEIEQAGFFVKMVTPFNPGGLHEAKIDRQGWGDGNPPEPGGIWRGETLKLALCAAYIGWKETGTRKWKLRIPSLSQAWQYIDAKSEQDAINRTADKIGSSTVDYSDPDLWEVELDDNNGTPLS